jgi:hypothetical protein
VIDTHGIYINRRQIVRIGVRRRRSTRGIEGACDLEELFSEISGQPTQGNFEWAVGAVHWPIIGNLVRLCLGAGISDSRAGKMEWSASLAHIPF